MNWSVGEVAALAGVTVRTLHHYDAVGLLSPGVRAANGYRRYSSADLDRLRRILFYRELDFGLDQIAAVLSDPDTAAHLRRQHRLLRERVGRLRAMLAAIETEMEATAMGTDLTPQEQFEVFGEFRPADYEAEVAERWADTEAYRQSRRRTAAYTKEDWVRIKAEADGITAGLATALAAGEPADGPVARGLAEEHRQHIGRWFYDCGYDLHRGLADLWTGDPRFTATFDAVAPGLAGYAAAAVRANAG